MKKMKNKKPRRQRRNEPQTRKKRLDPLRLVQALFILIRICWWLVKHHWL